MNDPLIESLTLLDLPSEILMEIFSYVNVKNLFHSVILTCKVFHDILTAHGFWETFFASKFKNHNIRADLEYIVDLRDVCCTYEDIDKHWNYREQNKLELKKLKLVGHYASIDAAYILPNQNICVTGSRDRSALVWNLSSFMEDNSTEEITSLEVLHGHQGWVWAIDSDKNNANKVVTASWDKSLKVWDLDTNGTLVDTLDYHPSAILDLCCHDNVYTTACYDKIVRVYDPRSNGIVVKSRHHKRPVICIKVTDKHIISGSEDNTVVIFDICAGKVESRIKIDSPAFCMNLAFQQGFKYLRVGGKEGSYYVYSMDDGHYTLLESSQLWQSYKVTALSSFQGTLVACSQSGAVRMYTPDRSNQLLETFNIHNGDVAAAHSRNNILLTGSSDTSVYAWKFSALS